MIYSVLDITFDRFIVSGRDIQDNFIYNITLKGGIFYERKNWLDNWNS